MKKPIVSKDILDRICASIPTPFHLYHEGIMRHRARALNDAFAWNPGYREYFALKANPNPRLLEVLRQEGCGADCSSLTELLLAGRAGFRGHEVMFSSNVTPEADMSLARQNGAIINLDDLSHVDFLQELGGIPEDIMLRYNPGDSFTIGNSIMSRPGSAKYGFTRPQLVSGIRRLRELGAVNFGIHAFLSSNTTDQAYYPALADLLFRTLVELKSETGARFNRVNLSGGVGIAYRPQDSEADIAVIGQKIRGLYRQILEPAGMGDVSVQTELGRWLMAPAGCLVSRVIHEKHIYKDYLGLDACAANLLRPAMYGAYHHITVAGKEDAPLQKVWDVTGGLCENNDKFAIDRMLPETGKGDLVVIHDTGAHGHSMGYNYNGKLRSAEVLLREDGTWQVIRRAETPADYFATLEV